MTPSAAVSKVSLIQKPHPPKPHEAASSALTQLSTPLKTSSSTTSHQPPPPPPVADQEIFTRYGTSAAHGGDDGRSFPIILYIQGGGFAFYLASSTAYDLWCRRLSGELNVVIVSVNYRLAPKH
ncbi:hypothetical protein QYF36_003829 [Acer negundo]|nr:hypothetical protein QYF36_003829 [Acer negundo]